MPALIVLLLLFMGLTHSHPALAESSQQETPDFDTLFEAIYARQEEAVENEVDLHQHFWELYQQPLDLNQASPEELKNLGILSDRQQDAFFRHLAKNGPLVSIYELQAIPDWDLETIKLLLPFVHVEALKDIAHSRTSWPSGLGPKNSYWLTRYERTLETKQGYMPNKKHQVPYVGSPDAWMTRLRIQHPPGWDVGFSGKKGAGEAFAWDPATQRYGLAPYRFHCLVKDRQWLKALVIGDYAVGYGQGLVLNTGMSMNRSSETVKVIRTKNVGIRPHQSLSQAAFRGIATTWQWPHWELTAYYSNIGLEGKVEQNVAQGGAFVRSVQRGGSYRTDNELTKKGQVREQVIGGTCVYKGPIRGAVLGANALYQHYSLPLYPKAQKDRNPMAFQGQDHANGSLFYQYLWQNFHFFGEGSLAKSGGKAAVTGVVASLSQYIDATILWRHYDQNFHGPFGQGFKENTGDKGNERGLYLGIRISPVQHFHLDAYYDYFYFPWFYGKPVAGHSWLAKATYQPIRTGLVYFQFKTTSKERRVPKVLKAAVPTAVGTQQRYKFVGKYSLSKVLNFHSAVQWSSYQLLGATTWGWAVVQDATYKLRRLQLRGRVAWFKAQDFENRLVFYEPNVLYNGFNFPAYYGQGMRYCLLVCYQPISMLRLELKYALTWYKKGSKIASGLEALSGNVKNDVQIQAVLRF